ncbi:uncharacterized protein LOC132277105 isoform X2 [Cornus florida]|uniref:uncharacterized protein LOC132277105 isoform X2 n=1 Tax=Cornus florida TaxID=4283 RepID=UPI00289C6976|nr:uncharacterized protein LOC132277105 isoform X2 [Cornus florida]
MDPTSYSTPLHSPTTSTLCYLIQSLSFISGTIRKVQNSEVACTNTYKLKKSNRFLAGGSIFFFSSMPGTILVSVLDFEGITFPSSSPPSSMSIKVSIGKSEYQTWDKGDFSFPLTTLRDNLVVILQDIEGNEISQTVVKIMSIVERGVWDDLFPFQGGGYVHMKLQFTLSEVERNRIRNMRETVVKKKQVELLNSSARLSETASTAGISAASSSFPVNEISAMSNLEVPTQVDRPSKRATFFKDPPSEAGNKEQTLYQKTTPKDRDRREDISSTTPMSQGVEVHKELVQKIQTLLPHDVAVKKYSVSPDLQDDLADKPEKQGALEKTPSNVRKMISAFESTLAQDMRPRTKSPATKSQLNKVGKEGPLKDQFLKDVRSSAQLSSGRLKNPFLTGELQQNLTNIARKGEYIGHDRYLGGTKSLLSARELKELSTTQIQSKDRSSTPKGKFKAVHEEMATKEERKSPVNMVRTFAADTATVSGRIYNEHSSRHQNSDLFTDLRDSGSPSAGIRRQIHSKVSHDINIRGASNDELKSVEYCGNDHYFFESSGAWIFADDTRHLCITTGGKRAMNLMGGCHVEAKTHQGKKSDYIPESIGKHNVQHKTDIEVKKGEKTFHNLRNSSPEDSSDVASTGPVRQAIKVAIMVAFGALVFLNRERKPRHVCYYHASVSRNSDNIYKVIVF